MFTLVFDFIYLFYVAITESLFVQIFTIIVFYIVSWFIRQPRKNWYDYQD